GRPGCLALVTSRDPLTGLVAGEGAHPLQLDVLASAEAVDLLTGRLGADRAAGAGAAGDREAAGEVARLCARLPLALNVAAARTAGRPGSTLATVAAELREAGNPLD